MANAVGIIAHFPFVQGFRLPAYASIGVTFGLLALAIVALWSHHAVRIGGARIRLWMICYAAALASAVIHGFVHLTGAAILLLFGVLAWWHGRASSTGGARALSGVALLVLGGLLLAHVAPGFSNPMLLHEHRFSADAAPYSQYANFDKGSAGLLLLAFCCAPLMGTTAWRGWLRGVLPVLIGTVTAVIAGALLLRYARFEPKFPAYAPVFLLLNLFFTCVAEEALFRGLLQRGLADWMRARGMARAQGVALVITAVLFGVAHTGGGIGYVLLATLAGLGYGAALLRTGRIEAAILVHFAVNATHFLGFTYPRLA